MMKSLQVIGFSRRIWATIGLSAFLLAVLVPMRALTAEGHEIRCPSRIETTQSAPGIQAPWRAVQRGNSSRLVFSELYAGPWENDESLPPDESIDSANRELRIWHLVGDPAPEGTWLVCSYQNTQVKIVRRLPDDVRHCEESVSTEPRRVIKLLSQRCF